MDYLKVGGDIHKYDSVKSYCLWGKRENKNPKYSIIIPTYKRIALLKETLQSAINQSYTGEYEIIVVDNDEDMSTATGIIEVLDELNCDIITYYKNERNVGIYGNFLKGAQQAAGEYLMLLGDDDLIHPEYLRVMDCYIKSCAPKGIIGCNLISFVDKVEFKKLQAEVYVSDINEVEFFFGRAVPSSGAIYPAAIIKEVYSAYDGLLMGDQCMEFKAIKRYSVSCVEFPLFAYRVASTNATAQDDNIKEMIYHMCLFREQTAEYNIIIKVFMYCCGRYYHGWYINGGLKFWKKDYLRSEIIERLAEAGANVRSNRVVEKILWIVPRLLYVIRILKRTKIKIK